MKGREVTVGQINTGRTGAIFVCVSIIVIVIHRYTRSQAGKDDYTHQGPNVENRSLQNQNQRNDKKLMCRMFPYLDKVHAKSKGQKVYRNRWEEDLQGPVRARHKRFVCHSSKSIQPRTSMPISTYGKVPACLALKSEEVMHAI